MVRRFIKHSVITLTLGLLIPSSTTVVKAQIKPDLDLQVFPPTAYLYVKPGKNINHHVVLQYNGTQVVQVTAQIHDFVSDGHSGVPVIQDATSFNAITLTNPDKKLGEPFIMHPNTQVDLGLKIEPSPILLEKEYTMALLLKAEPLPDRVGTNTGATTPGVIASNMIVWVSADGENKGKLTIEDFPMPRFIDSFGKISVAARARNTGQTALAPKGTITLYHWQGKELAKWFISPDVVLADSTRLLRATSTDPASLAEGDEVKLIEMSYDAPFLLGPYTVTTQLENLDGGTEQRTITVFAFPFSIIIAILVGIALYLGYLYMTHLLNAKRW